MKGKLIVASLILACGLVSSCSSDEDLSEKDVLPEVIATDFSSRYADYTIENFNDYAFDNLHYTEIICKDKPGNKRTAIYLNYKWNRTFCKYADTEQLPGKVEKTIKQESKGKNGDFSAIEEMEMNGIDHKFYRIEFIKDTANLKNFYYSLIIDHEGKVIVKSHSSHASYTISYPRENEIPWIKEHYEGANILGYVSNQGFNNYLIMHKGVLKSVYFRLSSDVSEWVQTSYNLPEDMKVPQDILDDLHNEHPEFNFTEVKVIEEPHGIGYSLIDGNSSYRLGYNYNVQFPPIDY